MNPVYALTDEECLKELKTSREGLSQSEVEARLKEYGPNVIESGKKINPITLFLKQFKNLFTLILAFAIFVSLAITIWGNENRIAETVFIFIIIFVNAILGFVQNYKAAVGIEALKNMVIPKTIVKRDGINVEIEASNVVPGDIIVLEEGEIAEEGTHDGLYEKDGIYRKLYETQLSGAAEGRGY